MKKTIYILLVLLSYTAYSQSFSVFNIDTSNFPTIKANFFAIDSAGSQLTNFSNSDFIVTENGQQRTVSNFSCPEPKLYLSLSSVLVFDVTGSMVGERLEIAKAGANAWINLLPLGKSECAITSFSDTNYLIQDFTTDKSKLIDGLSNLVINFKGTTNYNSALIDSLAGGILVAQKGKYKKVIVLLTDHNPNHGTNTTQIINTANANDIAIYCITLYNEMPQDLKDISKQTGGLYFENIKTKREAEQYYRAILMNAQGEDPCTIEWLSGNNCVAMKTDVEVKLNSMNLISKEHYRYSNKLVARLEMIPESLRFINIIPGIKNDTIISIKAVNSDFNVTNISSANPAYTITPSSFFISTGQIQNLTISYIPADSDYTYTKFIFETNRCQEKYYASGGFPNKEIKTNTIKLIRPNGKESFVVGFDTLITWEGVLPEDKVKIDYTTDNGKKWMLISDSAIGLSYKWTVPKTPSSRCWARVTASLKYQLSKYVNMVLIPAGSFQMGNTGAYTRLAFDENPVHEVTISKPFLMSKYEVTQKLYQAVMDTNPSYFKGENFPVEEVTWYDAVEFCNKLSELEGLEPCYRWDDTTVICNFDSYGYRLPTEAEWEYACRAGTATDFYNGSLKYDWCSPTDPTLNLIAWYCGNSDNLTYECGLKKPNDFGLFDMAGNIWEWCWDWFGKYSDIAIIDPKGPDKGSERVLRGGAWTSSTRFSRSSSRFYHLPFLEYYYYGFRIVRNY